MFLEVSELTKSFGTARVLTDVSFGAESGRTLAILGRSGCGKTTLLKILAGLETADSGHVDVDGRRMDGVPANERGIVYLYQEPLLFPHLDVRHNVAFGLGVRRVPKSRALERADAMLADLGLGDHARKRPEALSGGQRQRVAFGRALIVEPRLLLLDEPFGNLDQETRRAMQELFHAVATRLHITTLFVTHDLREALVVGDAFAYLHAGRLDHYPSRHAFLADPRVGAAEEIRFWASLGDSENPSP
jgi:putrescine transport system ATP-binding protein